MKQQDLADPLGLARDRWKEVLVSVGVDEALLTNAHSACPNCGGTDRFRFDDKEGRGTYYCNGCGAGHGMALMMKVTGWTFRQCADHIREKYLGEPGVTARALPVRDPRAPDEKPEESKQAVRERLQRMWSAGSRPMRRGDAAWRYLTVERRLPESSIPGGLHFMPKCAYYQEQDDGSRKFLGNHCAMLAKFIGAGGKAVGLHRTYLTRNGKKAPVPKVKKLTEGLGYTGGAIRLFEAGEILGVAEGIETALAVRAMCPTLPMWATGDAGKMGTLEVPENVREVRIFADNDAPDERGRRAGQEAAAKLKERLEEQGIRVRVFLPKTEGTDFMDVYLERLKQAEAA